MDSQTLIVGVIGLGAALFLIRRLVRTVGKSGGCNCGGQCPGRSKQRCGGGQ